MGEEIIERARQALAAYQPRRIQEAGMAPAAVLIVLYEKDAEPYVLLTERTHEVEHHKGQISFPGGACDEDDCDLRTTALRETFEEIGVRPEDVEVIGQLDDLITISNFNVTPFVGVLKTRSSYPFVPYEREVAGVLEVPLRHLLDSRNMELELRRWQGKPVLVPAYTWGRHRIWGATARILKQLLDLLA